MSLILGHINDEFTSGYCFGPRERNFWGGYWCSHINKFYPAYVHYIDKYSRAKYFWIAICTAARDAVMEWMLISKHLPIVKDIRLVIAKMVWDVRYEANYDFIPVPE